MQKINFDHIVDRKIHNSLKWSPPNGSKIAMGLADMDFRCPPTILAALQQEISHGILGYPFIDDEYYQSVIFWFNTNHKLNLQKEHILPVTGVIPALRAIIEEFTTKNDSIIIQTPVYYAIADVVKQSERRLICNPLIYTDDKGYFMGFNQLEQLKKLKPKIFVLCSPHNPVGRVWLKSELQKIAEYCAENNILLVVDEIHCDLIMPPHQFISCGSLNTALLNNIILLTSSTKTFNIAGLRGGNVFVFNSDLRQRLSKRIKFFGIDKMSSLFLVATKEGYFNNHSWVQELVQYLYTNSQLAKSFISNELDPLSCPDLQATYLLWVNFQQLCKSEAAFFRDLDQTLLLSKGSIFGNEGSGFLRMNIACPRKTLEQALNILKKHIRKFP